jgi:tight adherence protein C
MTDVVLLAVMLAIGIFGIASGLRTSPPSLDGVWSTWQRSAAPRSSQRNARAAVGRLGERAVDRFEASRWATTDRSGALRQALAVTGTDPSLFAARLIVIGGTCAFGPVILWLALQLTGLTIPIAAAALVSCTTVSLGLTIGVSELFRRAAVRRRHVRVIVGSFVDLVVLSLAGGDGIDGALHAASQVTPDWAAQRLARTLLTARDSGAAPWAALAALGEELGVSELVELATTVQLAGTEGARIRQSLTARGASLRRHEQAEAESAANAMTERLFFPGALLLLGFLVFIGYPAIQRILGGF